MPISRREFLGSAEPNASTDGFYKTVDEAIIAEWRKHQKRQPKRNRDVVIVVAIPSSIDKTTRGNVLDRYAELGWTAGRHRETNRLVLRLP